MDINRDGVMLDVSALLGIMGNLGGMQGKGSLPIAKKTSTRKYVCPVCGNSFRATKDINVLCMDCNQQYEKV